VIRGNAQGTEEMECVRDPTQTTAGTGDWKAIAAQCCESDGTCRRYIGDATSGCVAGHSNIEGVIPTTYAQAVTMCADHGLQLCEKSCRNAGCWYNRHPIWTALPCEASALAAMTRTATRNLPAAGTSLLGSKGKAFDPNSSLLPSPAPTDGDLEIEQMDVLTNGEPTEGEPTEGEATEASEFHTAAAKEFYLVAAAGGGSLLLAGLLTLVLCLGKRCKQSQNKPEAPVACPMVNDVPRAVKLCAVETPPDHSFDSSASELEERSHNRLMSSEV